MVHGIGYIEIGTFPALLLKSCTVAGFIWLLTWESSSEHSSIDPPWTFFATTKTTTTIHLEYSLQQPQPQSTIQHSLQQFLNILCNNATFCHLLLHEAHLCLCEKIVVEDEERGGGQYFLPVLRMTGMSGFEGMGRTFLSGWKLMGISNQRISTFSHLSGTNK